MRYLQNLLTQTSMDVYILWNHPSSITANNPMEHRCVNSDKITAGQTLPLHCFTATATESVRADIVRQLNISGNYRLFCIIGLEDGCLGFTEMPMDGGFFAENVGG
ncbi:hypothetical protein BC829DRAFT_181187 [Chytridium lagenaria]|nr:hypothetical protein BC829DRAFT_181187 [Chytridium lagenaria]